MKKTAVLAVFVSVMSLTISSAGAAAARPDLRLTITDSSDPAKAHHDLTYIITVRNAAGSTANSVQVIDEFWSHYFVSSGSTKGSCAWEQRVICNIGTLAVGEQVTVKVVVRPRAQETLTNSATVTSSGRDANPADNSASETTMVLYGPFADLEIEISGGPTEIRQNGYAGFVVTARNLGPEATWATVWITLPEGMRHVASGPRCDGAGRSVRCYPSSPGSFFPEGESSSMNLVVKATGSGSKVISSTISGIGSDPQMANNASSIAINVTEPAPLVAVPGDPVANLTLATSYERPSGEFIGMQETTFTVVVRNTGTITAEDVKLSDVIHPTPDTTLIALQWSQGSCGYSDGLVACRLGDISASAEAVVRVTVQANQSVAAGNAAAAETMTAESSLIDNWTQALALTTYQPPPPPDLDQDDDRVPDIVESFLCTVGRRLNYLEYWCYS